MGHHHHHHHHHHAHESSKNILVALILNGSFALIEVVGAYLTGSVAIMADAVHDLGDSLALGLAYTFERKAKKSADKRMSYGYRRFSLLSALFTSLFLVAGSVFVLTETIPRLFDPPSPHAPGMMYLALFGVAVNGYAAWRVQKGSTLNERVVSWHLLEDVLGWVAVLIGATIMMFVDWPIIDPLLSLGFTLFILRGVYSSLKATLHVFLQGVPEDIDLSQIIEKVKALDSVEGAHDEHLWSLDGERHVFTLHVVVAEGTELPYLEDLKVKIRDILKDVGNIHLTVEFEVKGTPCVHENCTGELS